MPEDNNDKSVDMIKREDYNKIVESHNLLKTEKEQLLREVQEIKQKIKESEEKKEWQKESESIKKEMDELRKQLTEKKDIKMPKGVVPTETVQENKESSSEKLKELLDKQMPDNPVKATNFASNIARFMHYKSPVTRYYNNEHLGKALSLHAGAQLENPSLINTKAKSNRGDIIVYQTPIN